MKNIATRTASMIIPLLFLFSGPASAQLPSGRQLNSVTTGSPAPAPRLPSKHIASILSSAIPGGARVTLTSDTPLGDYMAYRQGDLFYIVVPQSNVVAGGGGIRGAGFTNAKVETRGSDLLFSFRLEEGVGASVSQKFNRLEITFTKPGGLNAAVSSEKETGSASAPPLNSTRPRTVVPRAKPLAAPVDRDTDNIDQRVVDLSVPESPAFTVLGVTPDTVVRPTNPKEFASSFLNGVDQRGNFQTGLALDFVPFLTFAGGSTSLSSYANSRMERFLARTQVSFATTKGTTDEDKATRLALGLRLTLFDSGDPRLDEDLDACYEEVLNDPRLDNDDYVPTPPTAGDPTATPPIPADPGDSPAEVAAKLRLRTELLAELVKPCNDKARKRNWNNTSWIVGAAPSWISKTGETKNFVWNGGGFWTSIGYGFDGVSSLKDNSQLIFHARYRSNEVVPDPDNEGQFFSQDSLFLGTRLRVAPGDAANSVFSLEGNFVRSRRGNGPFDNSSRYSLGLEQRLAENIWFALSLGGQSGRTDGANQAFVLTSFKWGFSQKEAPVK